MLHKRVDMIILNKRDRFDTVTPCARYKLKSTTNFVYLMASSYEKACFYQLSFIKYEKTGENSINFQYLLKHFFLNFFFE